MNGRKYIIVSLIIINILMSIILNLFQCKSYAAATVKQTTSTDIASINDTKYPEIKKMIQDLQNKHPKWNFKVLYTGLKWDDVITGETKTHGTNVVNKSSYGKDWICSKCGKSKTYSGGSWYCASDDAVKYMMDPRNSLNENDIFQFLELSYDTKVTYNKNVIKEMLEDTFLDDGKLDTYINQIITSCKKYSVNPYFIASKIIQEQGTKGGSTFKMKGTSSNGKYKLDDKNKILTVLPGTKVSKISEYLGKTYTVKDTNGKTVKTTATAATGYKADKYTIAVLGDVNGDGNVKATDYMRIKNYILETSKLDNAQKIAADVNEDGKVKATDYMKIKNYILEKSKITIETNEYYYNIFNINATGKTVQDIIENALERAKEEKWTTIEKCIDGGVEFIAEGYIGIGQDSMYFEKFNVVNTTTNRSYYTHQYAQDLLYAQNQGTKLKGMLSGIDAIDNPYTFIIPLYESMPKTACVRPVSK